MWPIGLLLLCGSILHCNIFGGLVYPTLIIISRFKMLLEIKSIKND